MTSCGSARYSPYRHTGLNRPLPPESLHRYENVLLIVNNVKLLQQLQVLLFDWPLSVSKAQRRGLLRSDLAVFR